MQSACPQSLRKPVTKPLESFSDMIKISEGAVKEQANNIRNEDSRDVQMEAPTPITTVTTQNFLSPGSIASTWQQVQ